MAERKISKAQVTATIEKSERVVSEEDNIKIYSKKFDARTLEVVGEVIKHKIIVITVYWS